MRLKIASVIATLILIAGCGNNFQSSQLFKLPSGKEIKVNGMSKIFAQDGDAALVLNYETDIPIEDKDLLRKEVDEIWSGFQKDVEAANLNTGIIRAVHVEGSGIVRNGKGYGFVFIKGEDGQWHLTEDKKK